MCVCVGVSECALKSSQAGAEQEIAISQIICMTPQSYEILTNLAMNSFHPSWKGAEVLLPQRLAEECFDWGCTPPDS